MLRVSRNSTSQSQGSNRNNGISGGEEKRQKSAVEAEKAEKFQRYGSSDLASIFACLQILASLRLAIPIRDSR